MKIKFCGAAREVTGSAHLLTLDNGYKILLDCGLYQGHSSDYKSFNENWLFDPAEIDCLVLSHAHIDHSGRLPKIVKDGFKGNIISTHATRSLCAIMLLDSAHIQEKDAEFYNTRILPKKRKKGKDVSYREPLYTKDDVEVTMDRFVGYPYNQWFRINEDVEVLFKDAGHILGSASVTLRIRENGETKMFGFTGDVGRPNRPILRDPQRMPEVDYLICESTYGGKDHEAPPAEMDHFLRIIKETCVERKGKLIIPAFSVGRTQEIVYMLDQLETAGKLPKIPVYVDSPLAVNATMIFGTHPECYDKQLHEYLLIDDNPFGFNSLTYVRKVEVSKSLNNRTEPCIIISSSGMMNAGRVKHHLFNSIDQDKNTLLIVGYCSPETPGGKLRSGAEEIRLFGEMKPVRARIEIMDSFSAHADRNELLDFVEHQKGKLKTLFLVHGTIERQEKFRDMLNENGFGDVQIPQLGESIKLD
ncbi:MBL fold metallo-hydrolase RNA specificity domain-containing protein [Flavilitoribacter nigricans]|uniref:MBL fold metallo-hydrolase n=1 Tax=Flavilitoribacter nigricans (strain ATCC 23147 / DSM 23189 / NBRC 102662 / NCIMB 1420 / SS-2) TaxID=1122177 RepID=A0A2D0NB51_FLAN2|nr:MBL fold metallo-hydrolase [Flavilitoribacter nigricans]PHN05608.1 MBL fold metallo-hydrolase [Flavilitoribacter nigricans DSM 23189 = NBRC 102662]